MNNSPRVLDGRSHLACSTADGVKLICFKEIMKFPNVCSLKGPKIGGSPFLFFFWGGGNVSWTKVDLRTKWHLDRSFICHHIGSRPSGHYFRSVCWFVCLFVCGDFSSAVFDPISIKLGHMLYAWV